MKGLKVHLCLGILVSTELWVACLHGQAQYQFQTLDYPSAEGTEAIGIYQDTVVGEYNLYGQEPEGFEETAGNFQSLDFLGSYGTVATGVYGQIVVGLYYTQNVQGSPSNGFLYNGSSYTTIVYPQSLTTSLSGIYQSSRGLEMVGNYRMSGSTVSHGFTDLNGVFTTLDDPLGMTTLTGIWGNDIVGYYEDSSDVFHGIIYNGSTFTTLNYPGNFQYPSPYPPLGTKILGISGDLVVGSFEDSSQVNPFGNAQGFVYNLNTGAWTLVEDPNGQSTQVLGTNGTDIIGASTGFFLQGFEAEPIPEPSIGVLLISGLLFGLAIRVKLPQT